MLYWVVSGNKMIATKPEEKKIWRIEGYTLAAVRYKAIKNITGKEAERDQGRTLLDRKKTNNNRLKNMPGD